MLPKLFQNLIKFIRSYPITAATTAGVAGAAAGSTTTKVSSWLGFNWLWLPIAALLIFIGYKIFRRATRTPIRVY